MRRAPVRTRWPDRPRRRRRVLDDGNGGTELLFIHDPHCPRCRPPSWRDRRGDRVPGAGLAPGGDTRTVGARVIDEIASRCRTAPCSAAVRARCPHRVRAHRHGAAIPGERLDDLVVYGLVHVEPLECGTGLAGVDEAPQNRFSAIAGRRRRAVRCRRRCRRARASAARGCRRSLDDPPAGRSRSGEHDLVEIRVGRVSRHHLAVTRDAVRTPAGRCSLITSASASTDSGVKPLGLTTTVFPMRSDGRDLPDRDHHGQFHGPMAPTTPSGTECSSAAPHRLRMTTSGSSRVSAALPCPCRTGADFEPRVRPVQAAFPVR